MVSIKDVAIAFNSSREELKDIFEAYTIDDRKLTLVDVEFNSQSNDFDITAQISYLTLPIPTGPQNLIFGADDNWHIFHADPPYSNGARGYIDQNGTYHAEDVGAPEMIRNYHIAEDAWMQSIWDIYIPVNVSLNNMTPPGGRDNQNLALPTNPLDVSYYENYTLFKTFNPSYHNYYNSFGSQSPNPALFISYTGMNFFKDHGLKYELDVIEQNTGKHIADFDILFSVIPSNWTNYYHYVSAAVADLAPLPPPAPFQL